MKSWLRRIALSILVVLVTVVAAGSIYELAGRRAARREFPPPGVLVDIGGRRIHLDCRGTGAPIVVLQSGLDVNGSTSWSTVHDSLAATARTCAYSRAGVMWSDRSPGPVTAKGIADDLHAALLEAGERPPFVMVGHSLGGPLVTTFTKYFPDEVAGLVFVDASHPDQVQKLAEFSPTLANPSLTRFKIGATFAWTGLTRFMTRGTQPMPGQATETARMVNAYTPYSVVANLEERVAFNAIVEDAGTFRQLGDRPLVVLTALLPMPASFLKRSKLNAAQGEEITRMWKALHEDEASWSTHSRHVLLPDASHYIQYRRPDAVIEAVKSVVGEVRAGRWSSRTPT